MRRAPAPAARAALARALAACDASTQAAPPHRDAAAAGVRAAALAGALAAAGAALATTPPARCAAADPLAAARAAVDALWAATDEDLHRSEASLGSLASFLLPPPKPPTVAPAGDGTGRVRVTIAVRPGCDAASVLAACAAGFGPGGARVVASAAGGGTLTLTGGGGGADGGGGGRAPPAVEARLVTGEAAGAHPRLEVTAWPADLASPASPATAVLREAMRAANALTFQTDDGNGGQVWSRSWSWSSEGGAGGGGGGGGGGLFELGDLLRRSPLEGLIFRDGGDEGDGERAAAAAAAARRRRAVEPGAPSPHPSTPPLPRPVAAAVADLERLGCTVTLPAPSTASPSPDHWSAFAGYARQKAQVEEAMLPLRNPELCDGVAAAARAPALLKGAADAGSGLTRPRAVLFAGPPGCGKTTAASIAAAAAGAPLVYVPVEAIVSKFYGEAEQRLASVFAAARGLADAAGGKALVFVDEVDSLATSRGADMHEATRRCLGVLLRSLDGFATSRGVVTVLATNRPEDCDPALLSRCGQRIVFPLPDAAAREGIIRLYAAHLAPPGVASLTTATAGLSGRAIRDACEGAERAWAARLAAKGAAAASAPPLEAYVAAVAAQQQG